MKEKLAKLIDIKSIVTLVLTLAYVGLTFRRDIGGDQFSNIFNMVIAFYFGTQANKLTKKE